MNIPFNQAIHDNLVFMGFKHMQHEADWYDDGDGENGPHLSGGPAYDEYLCENTLTRVIVSESGSVECFEDVHPWELDGFVDAVYADPA